MAQRHIYSLHELDTRDVHALLRKAEELRATRAGSQLAGRSIVMLFLASSLRTRVSMELAARQLGANAVTLQADAGLWALEFRPGAVMDGDTVEHAKDAIGVLSRYADVLGVRAFPKRKSWDEDRQDTVLRSFMEFSRVPVLNLESCLYHPCQALADLLTISGRAQGQRPGKVVLTWAHHPKALPVAVPNSFALAVAQMGWDLTIAHPPGYDLPDFVMQACHVLSRRAGGQVTVTHDREPAFEGARFVYAKQWGRLDRYGLESQEAQERREHRLERWIVDADVMRRTDQGYFMHCLPVRRNVVVTDEVIDGPRSLILEQAENRLHAQKAILNYMLA